MAVRRVLSTAIGALALCLAATACSAGDDSSSKGPTSEKTSATFGFTAAPDNLDFTTTDGAAIPQVLLDNVYQGLVKLSPDGKIVGSLAKSWTVSPDNKTYDFQLQPNATFSNGDKFTADDVKFSIERVKSSAWKISLKAYMDVVDQVQVVSPTEVKVVLKQPSNDWLFRMTTRIGAMFDPQGVTDLANKAIGTGPYTVSQFNRNDSVVLTARSDYWATKPKLKTVKFQYFSDTNAENSALLSGGIDGIIALQTPDTLGQFKSNSDLTVSQGTTNGEVVLSMNNAKGVFTNKALRQAVNYAIDRKALVKAAYGGYGSLIGSMVPPTDPWYQDLSNAYPYDAAKAKALIAQSGVKNPSVAFKIPNLPYAVSSAQVVKSDLAKVGITANISVLQFPAAWLDQVFTKHDFDMSIIAHVEARDIATYGDKKYYWGYDNPAVTKLLAEADAGTPQQQITDYQQVAKTLSDDAVSDWLFLLPNIEVLRKGLSGVPVNGLSESFDVSGVSWGSGS
nr:ABC transporter substrate-binding protein [Cryptosporangium phraense]